MSDTVYECPDCEDRKMVSHNQTAITPTVWCSCGDFTKMEVVET